MRLIDSERSIQSSSLFFPLHLLLTCLTVKDAKMDPSTHFMDVLSVVELNGELSVKRL